jgi:hypothetical protein
MSEPKLENDCGLIIDPTLLADIRARCIRRRAELEAAGTLPPLTIAPGSSDNAIGALPAPLPIPLLPASWWQALLYGSREAILSPVDANTALRLVAHELLTHCTGADFTETIRVSVLRKALPERFGAKAWDCVNKLWRAAPRAPGEPILNSDQSQVSSGVFECPRSMPAWRREFHQQTSQEQRLLESMGGWPGAF